jgi:geranylgeranyl pyrophosphate synthase
MEDFGYQFGTAFQIIDDILDVVGDADKMGKQAGTDWKARQCTLPMIHFMQQRGDATAKERRRLLVSVRDQIGLVNLLNESESLSYARLRAAEFAAHARATLQSLPATAARDALVSLCSSMLKRVQ